MFVDQETKKYSLGQIGGKAFNLRKLEGKGFSIPKWICLTTDFFYAFLGNKKAEYQKLLKEYNENNRKKIIELIDELEFPDDLRDKLNDRLAKFGQRMAVRSSATDEDGEQHSFAGMMESYLNVEKDEIWHYIKECYKSCFSKRIMEYRKRNSLINEKISVAVILMDMVDADFAGVIFTSNPQTNNPDEILISAVNGLGEALVSGEKNSIDYVVNNLDEITFRDDQKDGLKVETIINLAKIARKIENESKQRKALDIEFAIKDDKIYVLQARKITAFSHIDKNLDRTILDNSNIIESYSGVTTPLTYTFAKEVYGKIYHQTLRNFFIDEKAIKEIEDDLNNMLYFYENRIYYKLNSWYKMTALYPGYNKNKKYMENMMGVKTPLEETEIQAKKRLYKIYLRFTYKMLRMKKDSATFLKKFDKVTDGLRNNNFEQKTNAELLKIYSSLENEIIDDFTTPIANDMGAMVFYGLLTDKVSKIKDGDGLISQALSRQGNVESAKQATELLEIVKEIKKDTSLSKEIKEKSSKQLVSELKKNERRIFKELNGYIGKFGARSMEELKLETVTLYENPEPLFDIIKQYLEIDLDTKKSRVEGNPEMLLLDNFTSLDKKYVKQLMKITKYFVRNRELLRLRRTYIYDVARNIFLRIGENLANDGIISEQRDVFFLEKDEVFTLAKGGPVKDVKKKIKERKEAYSANEEKETYERMYFYGDVCAENMIPIYSNQEKQLSNEDVLVGVSGGGGVVEGVVKFIQDPNDKFENGKILMAKRTDPGWTILFPMAKAIIVERGSILSHSAVVAREMGKTLVVGVRGLTEKVKDGDKIVVDGIKGTIEIKNE